jgi:pSer/pThr/pTyr-binding forkhead associated (FHA) protein
MERPVEIYRTACDMQRSFNLTLRHLASGAKFDYRMETPTIVVGSDPRCDFRLPEAITSPKELLIQAVFGRLFCVALGDSEDEAKRIKRRALGTSGLELNGFEIRAFEQHGDDAEVERSMNVASAAVDPTLPKGKYEFAMRNESRPGVVIPLDHPIIVIGRNPRCSVCFNSWSASRFHAAFISTPSGVWIVDLYSRTGTFIKEIPVKLKRLELGDRLRIGPSRFEFRLVQKPMQVGRIEPPHAPSSVQVVSTKTLDDSIIEDPEPSGDNEALALVSSLAHALSRNNGVESSMVDSRSIVRALNDMIRMQSLQLDEIRRLNAYLSANNIAPQALLELGERFGDGRKKPESSPIKPSGKLTGAPPGMDVHEWFQEENSESTDARSISGILKRILGGR